MFLCCGCKQVISIMSLMSRMAIAIFVVACISGHMSVLKFDCFLIAPAELRPRGRNPRRHPNFPRVKKYCFLRGIGNMRNLLDLKKLGAQSGPG